MPVVDMIHTAANSAAGFFGTPDLTMAELRQVRQHVLQFAPDALIVVDDRNRICFANQAVRALLGHDPQSLIGRPLGTLIPERLHAQHARHADNYARNPGNREMGARSVDLFALRADGSEFPAAIRLSPFRIGGKLFIGAAVRDDSEQQSANSRLVAARQEAERANRAKSRFLATASHDLRQPMQTIRLLNAALTKIVPEPDVRELLQQQSQAIESMTRLLNALLDISRLESGAIEPVRGEVSLAEVFEELRTEFASLAQARNIDLQIRSSRTVLATDRTLFCQLLQNLLGNALKYTDQGWVRLACSEDPQGILVAVEDSGIGIPADKLERIFDEYYQVDTHGAKRMGVGLGLAIVKEVSRLLGFSVKIYSEVGKGTKAVLRIPHEQRIAKQAPHVKPGSTAAPVVPIPKARLVLVEDNEGVRVATELFLKLEGYETLSAPTADQAQELLRSLRPNDVVIADYHLDGRSTGLEMLMGLRRTLGYDVPGVVLSGDLPAVLRSVRTPVAACRFLSKPVDTAALVATIAELSAQACRHESAVQRD
jgi:PAS domain S-box-containing protein